MDGWSYRGTVTIDNSGGGALSNYPVKLELDRTNFDFTKTESDGSDIRITDSDQSTVIPYHVLSYDPIAGSGVIWIKVPTIDAASTKLIYLFCGNSNAEVFDIPPIGPFTKYSTNPVIDSELYSGVLPENIIYDDATEKYWMLFEDRRYAAATSYTHGLAYSTDLETWTEYEGNPIYEPPALHGSNAPHLLYYDGTYYLYYGSQIYLATASAITGPYTLYDDDPVVPLGVGWEASRATEPYVFLGEDDVWYMFYMGDAGGNVETVGYATASAPFGPWTKYENNPVLDFDDPNDYDYGTIADPFVYYFDGNYYVYYASSPTINPPWAEAYAITQDFITFTKKNVILGEGSQFGWDDHNAHRGALSKFGDYYYLTYAGIGQYAANATGGYKAGIATQYSKSTAAGYPIEQVLDVYDNFSGDELSDQWRTETNINATGGTALLADGILALNSGAKNSSMPYIRLLSVHECKANTIIEASVKVQDHDGSNDHAAAVGFGGGSHRPTSVVNSAFWTTGKFSNGADFAYKEYYVNCGNDTSLRITTNLTVECWINVTNYNYQTVNYFLSKYSDWSFYISQAGALVVLYGTATAITAAGAFSADDLGEWVHVAFCYDGSETRIYKNGVALSTAGLFTGSIGVSNNLLIGGRAAETWLFNGLVDEIRISDSVRYTDNFTPAVAAFETDANTVALYHLDESSGVTINDSSINENDGTLLSYYGANIHAFLGDYWIKSASDGVGAESAMSALVDADNYQMLYVWLKSSEAQFKVGNGDWETLSANVPATGSYPVVVTAQAKANNLANTDLLLNYILARPYAEPEPSLALSGLLTEVGRAALADAARDGAALTDAAVGGATVTDAAIGGATVSDG